MTILHSKRMGCHSRQTQSNLGGKETEGEEEQTQMIGDLPGCMPTKKADMKLKEVYGD